MSITCLCVCVVMYLLILGREIIALRFSSSSASGGGAERGGVSARNLIIKNNYCDGGSKLGGCGYIIYITCPFHSCVLW